MKLKDPIVQREWLQQHITHRLRAAIAGTPFLAQLLQQQVRDHSAVFKLSEFCRDMAMWEGRHAAVRWLIEFVGVSSNKNGNPKKSARRSAKESTERKERRLFEFDVDISDLPGGEYFDLDHKDAKLLAEVWLGCSQATSHPTFGSNHPSLARDRLVEATRIVIQQMQKTIYASAGTNAQLFY